MAKVFFKATEDALRNITEVFNFVHPLRVSMLYTRKVIAKLHTENENADDEFFKAEIDPNNYVHGVGYTDAFLNSQWDIQEEHLAWLLLNNLFAIHEGWAESLFLERFQGKGYTKESFITSLEYTGLSAKLTSYYVTCSKRSPLLANAFFKEYKNASRLNFSKLDNYMLMYRYFKEARNCFMHGNRIASQRVIDAYNAYSTVATLIFLFCLQELMLC